MKADLQFDFLVNKENSSIIVKREFAAKRQLVWDCYSKSELLDQWFSPKPLTTKTKYMDFREGGYWHYAMVDPNGQQYWGRLEYMTISPIDNFTALDGFSDESGAINSALPTSSWDVRFTDALDRCLVTTIVSYKSSEQLQKVIDMGVKQGLTSTLERLDELLIKLKSH